MHIVDSYNSMQEIERHPSLALPPRPRAPPPPLPSNAPTAAGATMNSSVQLVDGASLSDVLLRQRWAVHWMSRLFHFQRPELHAYAHELVKFLREEALAGFRRAFGYRVSIRHTRAFVAFDVAEEREAKDADLAPPPARSRAQTLEPPGRLPRAGVTGARKAASSIGYDQRESTSNAGANTSFLKAAATAAREDGRAIDEMPTTTLLARRGSFVLYFSEQEEDEAQQRRSMMQRRTKERQYVVLLRGDEGLLGWACAWLQQRFQCIVSSQQMRISPLNLKWLARNWVADALASKDASSDVGIDAAGAYFVRSDAVADAIVRVATDSGVCVTLSCLQRKPSSRCCSSTRTSTRRA